MIDDDAGDRADRDHADDQNNWPLELAIKPDHELRRGSHKIAR